jgi:hypothetical protein
MLKRGVATLCLLLAVGVTACGETVSTDPNDCVREYSMTPGRDERGEFASFATFVNPKGDRTATESTFSKGFGKVLISVPSIAAKRIT